MGVTDDELREIVTKVKRGTGNKDILAICEFVELMLGNPQRIKAKRDEVERRRLNTERVRRWRASQKNPFEDV